MFSSVYLDFLIRFFAAPIVILGIVVWRDWFRVKKTACALVVCTIVFGLLCDGIAIYTGLWRYDTGRPSLGVWAFGIPLEEFLFYFLFPLLVLNAWCFLKRFFAIALRREKGR